MTRLPDLPRRRLLTAPLLAAGLGTGGSRAALAGPDAPVLLVPGPEDGVAARWAGRVVQRVGRLPPLGLPRTALVGGPDGVTAANRFSTAEAGDGRLLLVLTGAALLARLLGAGRAGYDPSGWLPLCLSWQGAVIAGRGPMPAATQRRPPLRLAVPGPEAPEAGALLALEALGLMVAPVGLPGVALAAAGPVTPAEPTPAEAAFAAGALDTLLLSGPEAAGRARMLGATVWFTFPGSREPGQGGREAAGQEPGAEEAPEYDVLSPAPGPLRGAVHAAIGGAQLRAALVLPALTSANMVATWRQGALRWREAERALPGEGEPLVGGEAGPLLASLSPPPEAVLAWRDWLSRRLGWRAT